jgi:ubiquinone/menaquinone biosynthesis C-methylase UbiE
MSLCPANNVLDLAGGTGAITIPAARAVGPSGTVFGVDISPASLSIARDKATNQGLGNATFVEHDTEHCTRLKR